MRYTRKLVLLALFAVVMIAVRHEYKLREALGYENKNIQISDTGKGSVTSSIRDAEDAKKSIEVSKLRSHASNSLSNGIVDLYEKNYKNHDDFYIASEDLILANARSLDSNEVINLIELLPLLDVHPESVNGLIQVLFSTITDKNILNQDVIAVATDYMKSGSAKTSVINGIMNNSEIASTYEFDDYIEFSVLSCKPYGDLGGVSAAALRSANARGDTYLASAEFATALENVRGAYGMTETESFFTGMDETQYSAVMSNSLIGSNIKAEIGFYRANWIENIKNHGK